MQMTDWFLANQDEAEQIASIVTTEERDFEDWPHIEFPLIELELMALSAALQGADPAGESILEKPLVWDEEGLCVARVKDAFIQALARVKPEGAEALAEAWGERIEDGPHEPEELHEFVSLLTDFARDAVARGIPVIELRTF